jgi:hypothetical protein
MSWYLWAGSLAFWAEYFGVVFAMAFSKKWQAWFSPVQQILRENGERKDS